MPRKTPVGHVGTEGSAAPAPCWFFALHVPSLSPLWALGSDSMVAFTSRTSGRPCRRRLKAPQPQVKLCQGSTISSTRQRFGTLFGCIGEWPQTSILTAEGPAWPAMDDSVALLPTADRGRQRGPVDAMAGGGLEAVRGSTVRDARKGTNARVWHHEGCDAGWCFAREASAKEPRPAPAASLSAPGFWRPHSVEAVA